MRNIGSGTTDTKNEQTAQDISCYEGGVRRDQDKCVGVVPEHLESVVVDVKSVGVVPQHLESVAVDVKSVGVVPEHLESDVKSGGVAPITPRVELGSRGGCCTEASSNRQRRENVKEAAKATVPA